MSEADVVRYRQKVGMDHLLIRATDLEITSPDQILGKNLIIRACKPV